MLSKKVRFQRVRFDVSVFEGAIARFAVECAPAFQESMFGADLTAQHAKNLEGTYGTPGAVPVPDDLVVVGEFIVRVDEAEWTLDSRDEFFTAIRQPYREISFAIGINPKYRFGHDTQFEWTYDWGVRVWVIGASTTVTVRTGARSRVEAIMAVFHDAEASCRLADEVLPDTRPRVFIGHGHSEQWRLLAEHLRDSHGHEVEAFESGARAGHTVRDVLEGLLESSDIALLVMTAEDAQADGGLRARQNVVHEAGLFQGRLGFPRAIILLEKGTEPFSNVDGVQYI